jgi:hypothetical protein
MPLTGGITPGSSFFCPHCGALYAMTLVQISRCDRKLGRRLAAEKAGPRRLTKHTIYQEKRAFVAPF